MIEALAELLPMAFVLALSPLPIMAVILALMAPSGLRGGIMLVLGRLLSLLVAVGLAGVAAEYLADLSGGGVWGAVLQLLLGSGLVIAAFVSWSRRPRGGKAALPAMLESITRAQPARAFGLGLLVTVTNPKDLAIAIGAGLSIGATIDGIPGAFGAAAVFALIATLTAVAPLVAFVVLGEGAGDVLTAVRDWLTTNLTLVLAVILLLIGVLLISDGLAFFGESA
ncbi:GAP family protein [Microbacterium sp. NPDC057650]|uniref:GAP family protein n=1 Tax=unclassified Microbacterium TaxID=2609290 RepID=UPI00366FE058